MAFSPNTRKLEELLIKYKLPVSLIGGGGLFEIIHVLHGLDIRFDLVVPTTMGSIASYLLIKLLEKNRKLEELSSIDPLTGLLNRRTFGENVTQNLSYCERDGFESILLYMDLDYFKLINDRFGHPEGDEVLKTVSEIFRKGCRKYDFLARLGGEEFAIYFPETDIDSAIDITERLRKTIADFNFHCEGEDYSVTGSFGIVSTKSLGYDFERLSIEADRMLYSAKRDGRNRIVISS